MLGCPRGFGATQASASLENNTGASHVAEAGVRVEMMKIESDPNFLAGWPVEAHHPARIVERDDEMFDQ